MEWSDLWLGLTHYRALPSHPSAVFSRVLANVAPLARSLSQVALTWLLRGNSIRKN